MEGLVDHVAEDRLGSRQHPALRDFGGDVPDEEESRDGDQRHEGAAQITQPAWSVGMGDADAQGLPPFQKVPGASSAPGPTSFSPPSSRKNW